MILFVHRPVFRHILRDDYCFCHTPNYYNEYALKYVIRLKVGTEYFQSMEIGSIGFPLRSNIVTIQREECSEEF